MRLLMGSVPVLDLVFKQDKGLLFTTEINWITIKQLIEIIPQMSE